MIPVPLISLFPIEYQCLHRAVILVLRVLIAREEMRLPERKKPVLDSSGARNAYYESTLRFLTLPTTLFVTLCQ
jgi:hypothetical protein